MPQIENAIKNKRDAREKEGKKGLGKLLANLSVGVKYSPSAWQRATGILS